MMVSYILTYGDRRTKGEVIRLLFHAAGVEFEDIRVSIPDEYNKLPLGKSFWNLLQSISRMQRLILGPCFSQL